MNRVFTWSNVITTCRMFFGTIGVYVALFPGYFFQGMAIFFILGLLPDALDGWVARAYDQRSRIGEFIDPLADKILFYLAVSVLFRHYVWWPIFILLFVCDVVSTVIHFYKNGGAVRSGKWKFILQCTALGFFTGSVMISKDFIAFANLSILSAFMCACHSLYHRLRS